MSTKKRAFNEKEEIEFFYQLGFRFFSSVIRGYLLGHKRPLSAARDYLHFDSLDGMDREASEFLVDVAHMGRDGGLSMQELYRKWTATVVWHPTGNRHFGAELEDDAEKESE